MLTGIDHVIIGVSNLDQAAHIFSEQLGLIPSGGGTHPTGGTANRIIVIGDTYLELIAVRTPAEAQASMLERLAKGEGYLNFVLASDDIQAEARGLQERGIAILGPTPGQLNAAQGRSRSWSRIDIERPDLAQQYPFLIQHDSSGEERRSRLAGWITPPEHPLGATKVLNTTIAVANLEEATRRFAHIYGLEASEPFEGDADGWDAMLTAFPLGTEGQCFELAMPLPLSTLESEVEEMEHVPEAGALAYYLSRYGESLCRMTLAVESLNNARRFLDERRVTYTYQQTPQFALWIHPGHACGASIVLHEQVG